MNIVSSNNVPDHDIDYLQYFAEPGLGVPPQRFEMLSVGNPCHRSNRSVEITAAW